MNSLPLFRQGLIIGPDMPHEGINLRDRELRSVVRGVAGINAAFVVLERLPAEPEEEIF